MTILQLWRQAVRIKNIYIYLFIKFMRGTIYRVIISIWSEVDFHTESMTIAREVLKDMNLQVAAA